MTRNRRGGQGPHAGRGGARGPRAGRGARSSREDAASPGAGDLVYGIHPVREALRARRRRLDALWIRAGASRPELDALVGLAEAAGVPVEFVERERIDAGAPPGAQTQGVALRAGDLPERSLAALLDAVEAHDATPRLVALDGVEDPQNVGAIARVADSAGAAGLVLTERRAAPLSAAVARASAGAIEWLPVARVPNLRRALVTLRDRGFWSVGATAEEGRPLWEVEDRLLEGPLVVVLGAEGRGIRPGVLGEIDHKVRIPMLGGVDSLNVATAGAVLLYDLLRRQHPTGADRSA